MYRLKDISIYENLSDEEVFKKALKKYSIPEEMIKSWRIYRKSIDARKKSDVHFVYTFDIEFNSDDDLNSLDKKDRKELIKIKEIDLPKIIVNRRSEYRPVIIGAGPAGLFTALTLVQNGIKPIIVEQGKKVEDRIEDVEMFKKTGKLNTLSNIQFGEVALEHFQMAN